MSMYRVTTPTIILEIENEDFDMTTIDICHVSIQNHSGRNLKIFDAKDGINVENKTISVQLTQEDTKVYEEGLLDVQLKIKLTNEQVISSDILNTTMKKILEEDIL